MKRAAVFAGLVVGWLALLLAPAAPASAHAVLASSTPPANAILTTAPSEVVLTFSEAVRQVPDKIRVIAPDGSRADPGQADVRRHRRLDRGGPAKPNGHLSGQLPGHLRGQPPGRGRVHVLGRRTLRAAERRRRRRRRGDSRLLATTIPIVKYVGYAGLVLLVGPALVLALLWPQRLSRRGADPAGVGRARAGRARHAGRALAPGALHDRRRATSTSPALSATCWAASSAPPIWSGSRCWSRPPSCCGRCCPGRGGTADRALLRVLAIVGAGDLAAVRAPGRLAGARRSPWSSTRSTWPGWRSGWAACVMLVGVPAAPGRRTGAGRDPADLVALGGARRGRPAPRRRRPGADRGGHALGAVRHHVRPADHRQDRAVRGGDRGRGVLPAAGAHAGRRVAAVPLRRAIWAELAITAVVLALSASLVQTTPARTAEANATGAAATTYYSTLITARLYTLQVEVDPASGRQQLGPPVRVHQGQPAAAGGGVEGHGGAAVGRHRADRGARCCR